MIKRIFSALVCAVMLVSFTACEKEEPEVNNQVNTSIGNEQPTLNTYEMILITDNLEGATVTLNKTSDIVFTDEVILTITPSYEASWWKVSPSVEISNAVISKSEELENIYTFKLTGFSANSVVMVSGKAKKDFSRMVGNFEAIDLGLTSGLLWATCNVGATTPEESGDYFAWGEFNTKANFSWDTYKYSDINNGNVQTKYNSTDKKEVLDLEDDVAHLNWGENWRMPTFSETEELRKECTWEWTNKNNVNGYEIKGASGNSIFIPAAGWWNGSEFGGENIDGIYWTASLLLDDMHKAHTLRFNSTYKGDGTYGRCTGRSVRAVCSPE